MKQVKACSPDRNNEVKDQLLTQQERPRLYEKTTVVMVVNSMT